MAQTKKEPWELPKTPEEAKADYEAFSAEDPGEFLFSKQALLELAEQAIAQREQFQYDPNADALYRRYRDSYARQGQQAMEDTVGLAASLTGGYGSSYGITAGQQAYAGAMGQLSEVLPELYQLAYQRYADETEGLQARYDSLLKERSAEYDAHQEAWRSYEDKKSTLYSLYEDALRQQDQRYSRLYTLILQGYEPTTKEIAAAGMHQGIVAALREAYRQAQLEKEGW